MSRQEQMQTAETDDDAERASERSAKTGSLPKPNLYDHEIGGHVVHPVATIFPMISGDRLDELAEDIRQNGLHEAIWLDCKGRVIDGRNRLAACSRAGVEPAFRTWSGDGSLVAFVLSQNMHRRHLTTSQRALAAARAAEAYKAEAHERQTAGTNPPANLPAAQGGEWRERAGADFGVSARSVQHAADVLASGDTELIDAVDGGEVAVSAGAAIAKVTPRERKKALAGGRKEVAKAAREVRKKRHAKTKATVKQLASEPDNAAVPPRSAGIAPTEEGDLSDLRRFARDVATALRAAGIGKEELDGFFLMVRDGYATTGSQVDDTKPASPASSPAAVDPADKGQDEAKKNRAGRVHSAELY